MVRIRRFGFARRYVRAAGLATDVDSQFRVTRPKPPPISDAIVRCQLCSVRFALLSVAEDQRKRRWRIDLLFTANVIVIVVKPRQRKGQLLALVEPGIPTRKRAISQIRSRGYQT